VNVQRLASGRVYDEEWERISKAMETMHERKIAFNEQGMLTVGELRAQSRRAAREFGDPCLIVVDYLQLMVGGDSEANRAAQLSEITRGLKLLAKELQVPVMALSQLNRNLENRVNKRPTMADLRDSGSIEQDADVILSIYRDEVYHPNSNDAGIAEVIINKQRNGPIGSVKLTFLADHTRFENYASPLRG
jgi:replicative DNA helicase